MVAQPAKKECRERLCVQNDYGQAAVAESFQKKGGLVTGLSAHSLFRDGKLCLKISHLHYVVRLNFLVSRVCEVIFLTKT